MKCYLSGLFRLNYAYLFCCVTCHYLYLPLAVLDHYDIAQISNGDSMSVRIHRLNGMGCNGMRYDGMKWDGRRCDAMGWDAMG